MTKTFLCAACSAIQGSCAAGSLFAAGYCPDPEDARVLCGLGFLLLGGWLLGAMLTGVAAAVEAPEYLGKSD